MGQGVLVAECVLEWVTLPHSQIIVAQVNFEGHLIPVSREVGDIVWWGLNFQCLMMTSEFRFGWLLREV